MSGTIRPAVHYLMLPFADEPGEPYWLTRIDGQTYDILYRVQEAVHPDCGGCDVCKPIVKRVRAALGIR